MCLLWEKSVYAKWVIKNRTWIFLNPAVFTWVRLLTFFWFYSWWAGVNAHLISSNLQTSMWKNSALLRQGFVILPLHSLLFLAIQHIKITIPIVHCFWDLPVLPSAQSSLLTVMGPYQISARQSGLLPFLAVFLES